MERRQGERMKKIKAYKLTCIAIIFILIGILMPGSDVPSVGIPNIDKLVHLGMFMVLSLCFYGEYAWHNKKLPHTFWTWISIELYAVLTEFMQRFVEGRSCDFIDFVADSIGILLAIIISRVIYSKSIHK